MKKSLNAQINFFVIILIGGFGLTVIMIYIYLIKAPLKEVKEELLLSNAKEVSSLIDQSVDSEFVLLSRFGNSMRLRQWLNDLDESSYEILEQPLKTYGDLIPTEEFIFVSSSTDDIYISSRMPNGDMSMPHYYDKIREDNMEQQWYFDLMESSKATDKESLFALGYNSNREKIVLWMYVLVKDEEKNRGIVGLSLDIESVMASFMEQTEHFEDIYIVDEEANIRILKEQQTLSIQPLTLSRQDSTSIYSIIESKQLQEDIRQYISSGNEEAVLFHPGKDYKDVVIAPISWLGWYVVHFNKSSGLTMLMDLYIAIIWFVIQGGLICVITIWFVKRYVTHPIAHVYESVEWFRQEREPVKPKLIPNNEIGDLAESIYSMEQSIIAHQNVLENQLKKRSDEIHQLYGEMSTSERNLKRLFQELPIGIVRFDRSFHLIYANQMTLRLLELEAVSDYQKKQKEVAYFPFENSQSKESFEKQLLSHKFIHDYRVAFKTTTFKRLVVVINAYRVDIEGEYYFEGIVNDMTKRMAYEDALVQRANYDSLTGAMNRVAYMTKVMEELNHQDAQSMFFLVFDFDAFKAINDTYGHLTGDEVLKQTIQILTRIIEGMGFIGRIGGDEFSAFLRVKGEEPTADSFMILEEMRMAVKQNKIRSDSGEVMASISIGVTKVTLQDDFKSLYYRGDQALYEAKSMGKNCIKWYTKDKGEL